MTDSRVSYELCAKVAAHQPWYHTMELAPGVVTPGIFDLRETLRELPWPDVRGLRCLDVATFDGFFAFEMERRGAAEVVATDIESLMSLDWTQHSRPHNIGDLQSLGFGAAGTGQGFRLAAEALGSSVVWRPMSVYDLDPVELGIFDVVMCGSILVHLRDPLRALEAVRSVCAGSLVSSEPLDVRLQIMARKRPVARLDGSALCQWWSPNAAGHRQMLEVAGFEVERWSRPHLAPYNMTGRDGGIRSRRLREATGALVTRGLARTTMDGVLQQAVLAHPQRAPNANAASALS